MFQKNDSSLYKGAFDGQPQGLSLRVVRNYRFKFLRLAKDYKGLNPLLKITQRKTRHSKCYTLFSWRRARDSAHFVRRKVCYANYPDYRLLLTRLRLAKDCKGSNPINNLQKNNGTVFITPYRYFWRRARDSNPRNRFGGLHDFQSCSFDQLGQLSVLPVILYTIV